jgi:hypothetical protein
MDDLTQDERKILKKRAGGKEFFDIAGKLAKLGEELPMGESASFEKSAPLTPAEIERRMVAAFRRGGREHFVLPVSAENGTRQAAASNEKLPSDKMPNGRSRADYNAAQADFMRRKRAAKKADASNTDSTS